MTMGAYDMVVIIDAPNDDAFASLAISIAKGGNIRTTTLKAFDEGQYPKRSPSGPSVESAGTADPTPARRRPSHHRRGEARPRGRLGIHPN